MRKVLFYIYAIIIFAVYIQARASENTFSQVWPGFGISKEINSKFELGFDKEVRYETGLHNKNFDKMTFAANYDATRWLQLGAEIWRGQIRNGSEWRKENKPVLIVNFKYYTSRLELSARHKLEYRIIENYENIPVYKFRTQVKYPIRNNKYISEMFINDETFFNLKNNTFNLNRLRAGIKLKYNFLSPDINYVFQFSRKNGEWQYIHAIAVKVWLQF